MDGLSGAASIIAVISLAVQLGDSIYKLSRLLKSIHDAPKELRLLINDLDRLQQILAEVVPIADLQKGLDSTPAPSVTLLTTLEECQLRFQSLEAYVSKVASRIEEKGIRKVLTPLKNPIQKDTLQRLQGEMRQSIDHLGILLIINSTKIQLANLGQAQTLPAPTPRSEVSTISHSSILSRKDNRGSFAPKENTSTVALHAWYKFSETISYGTVFGLFRYYIACREFSFSKRRELEYKRNDSMKRDEWSIVIFICFINRYFEFQSQISCGRVERRWRIYPMDPGRQSPAWTLCENGDTQGILNLFSQGLSPYLKDGQGRSLLNAASENCHTELCRVLLQQGVSLCAYIRLPEMYRFDYPLFDIYSMGNFQSVWDTVQLLVRHGDESEDSSLGMIDGTIFYLGNDGLICWEQGKDFSNSFWSHPNILDALSSPFRPESYETFMLKPLLRGLGQQKFSITCEEDTSTLDALFALEDPQLHNIWSVEADSEYIGQEFCLILKNCGIDAQKFVDRMMDMNGGDDVYLQSIDYGPRGIGRRRLMRGKYTPLSLRWEWSPPPGENPYYVLEEFGQLYITHYTWYNDSRDKWPFGPSDEKSEERSRTRKETRRFKRAQRRDRVNQRVRKMPGAFLE